MRRFLLTTALMISPAVAAENPPPIPPPQHQAADQVKCQRELLTWVVSYLDDPGNESYRKNFVSKTLALANCANGDAVAPVGRPIPEPPVPPEAPKKE